MKTTFRRLSLLAALTLQFGIQSAAQAQIYLANYGSTTAIPSYSGISKYTLSGVPIDADLASTPIGTLGIAASGTHLFVTNNRASTLSRFTNLGTPVAPPLSIPGQFPGAIAAADGYLYMAMANGIIAKYTDTGDLVNPQLITNLPASPTAHALAITVSDNKLYVTSSDSEGGHVGVYTTSGDTINRKLVSGLDSPKGIAVSGDTLFVSETNQSWVGKYTTSGALISEKFISSLNNPGPLAIIDDSLYILKMGNHTLGHYTTDGATINANLITGLANVGGMVIVVPEPSTWALALAASLGVAFWTQRHRNSLKRSSPKTPAT